MTTSQSELVVTAGDGQAEEAREAPGVAPAEEGGVQPDAETTQLVEQVKARLEAWTQFYQTQVEQLQSRVRGADEIAEPISNFFGIAYQWWNLIALGPFQSLQPGGPFRPQKIIRVGERAFMLVALWRNPVPLPGGINPSAAQIMSPFRYRVRGETINLSAVINGPDFAPVTNNVGFGGGFVNIHRMDLPSIPPGQQPQEGRPVLYEANFTVDILGVGPGLPPFAGFSTSQYDPDDVPPFVFPFIPGVGPVVVPGRTRGLRNDVPTRYLVYT